jgi:hypothetical protein
MPIGGPVPVPIDSVTQATIAAMTKIGSMIRRMDEISVAMATTVEQQSVTA